MRNDFDRQWEHRRMTHEDYQCTLSDEEIDNMIRHAIKSIETVDSKVSTPTHQRSIAWWLAFAAAVLLAIIIPATKSLMRHSVPTITTADGQQIEFLCNCGCDVASVICFLDKQIAVHE